MRGSTCWAAGPILRETIAAAELRTDWNIGANVWSVTSYTELRRDGMAVSRWNRLHPADEPRTSHVERCLAGTRGPAIAASDYVGAVADLVRPWVPRRYVALGTDGYGRSDTRAALRRFFGVDRHHIAVAALAAGGRGQHRAGTGGTRDRRLRARPGIARAMERLSIPGDTGFTRDGLTG